MKNIFLFIGSQSTCSFDEKELSCGGHPCRKCGACRDWYQSRNGNEILKRTDANCNCEYMYRHKLVQNRDPDHFNNQYYPRQNLICICRDNY